MRREKGRATSMLSSRTRRIGGPRWSKCSGRSTTATRSDLQARPFSYSDTGYVLASSLIECASGLPIAGTWHELLGFDTLGVDATYLESLEQVPAGAGPRSHQFLDDVDTYSFDPSMDLYGAADWSRAQRPRALRAGSSAAVRSSTEPSTLDTMLEEPDTASPGAAMGLFREEIYGTTCWSHQGFWGTGGVLPVPTSTSRSLLRCSRRLSTMWT